MARVLQTGSGQPGNALPIGGGLIQSESSDVDTLTIQAHSSQAGDLLNISTHKPSSTDESGEILNVDASGYTRIQKKAYSVVATSSTTLTVSATDSGKNYIIGANAHGMAVTLPAVAGGLNYKFTLMGACASNGFSINSGSSDIYFAASTGGKKLVAATVADAVGGAWIEVLGSSVGWHATHSLGQATAIGTLTISSG